MSSNDRYTSLRTCLFDEFTEPDKYPAQDEHQNWAIYEGLMRRAYDLFGVQNLNPVAKIEHTLPVSGIVKFSLVRHTSSISTIHRMASTSVSAPLVLR